MDASKTTIRFEKPGNFVKNQLILLLPRRNTGFYK